MIPGLLAFNIYVTPSKTAEHVANYIAAEETRQETAWGFTWWCFGNKQLDIDILRQIY